MKNKRVGALCCAMLLAGTSVYGSTGIPVSYVHAADAVGNTKVGTNITALEFLDLCDEKMLIQVTVTEAEKAEMLEVVNQITEGKTKDIDRARAIYDWITEHVDYTPEGTLSSDPYQVFKNWKAVCGGYSNLLKEMMALANIPAVALVGIYGGSLDIGNAHQWNAIYVGEEWIVVDSVAPGHFDNPGMAGTHHVKEIKDVSLVMEEEGLEVGYYDGMAVVGCTGTSVRIPDEYEGYPITSISYTLFGDKYKIQDLHINANITSIEESTLTSSSWIKSITVSEENTRYSSHGGALFTKDKSRLVAYPAASESKTFTLPRETTILDTKESFKAPNLEQIEVEEGNTAFSSYDGALYNAAKTELVFVPQSKKSVTVYGDAQISGTAFAHVNDFSGITIIAKAGSPAADFAEQRGVQLREYPEISPRGGEYHTAQEITITAPVEHAKIYYTTDGTEPGAGSQEYKAPFTLESDTVLKVVVMVEGEEDSQVVVENYKISKDAPADTNSEITALRFLDLCDEQSLINVTVTGNEKAEMQAVVDQVTAGKTTDVERARAIYTWVTEHVTYMHEGEISSDPYKVFDSGKAVCGGYSNLLKEMLALADIPAVALIGFYGNSPEAGGAHQWNAVYVGGKWVVADAVEAGYFDNPSMANSHHVREIKDVTLLMEEEGLEIGYYNGMAVVGCTGTSVNIPDEYEGYPITSISYTLFGDKYKIQDLHINANITSIEESTLTSSSWIKSITVSEENTVYSSEGGALFTKNKDRLVAYPAASESKTFTLPRETTILDTKESFRAPNLEQIEVEEGNTMYASYAGVLYDAAKTEMVFVPQSKKVVTAYGDAQISGTAFAHVSDFSSITMIAKAGSPAADFARQRGMYLREYPEITPGGGEYSSAQEITITVPVEGAKIYYTTDGTEPGTGSQEYKTPFTLESDTILKVLVMIEGEHNSQVVVENYKISQEVQVEETAAPSISPESGAYQGAQEIVITGPSQGAKIYYTLDGSTPTKDSTLYTGPFTITADTKVKAIAVEDGKTESRVVTMEYEIKEAAVVRKPWIFTDVKEDGGWKHTSVDYVYQNDIMADVGGSKQFQPDEPLTRAMFATVLYRMAGEPAVSYQARFSDVPAGEWYSEAVVWAYNNGIVQGIGDGKYGTNQKIKRQEIAKMLCVYAGVAGYDNSQSTSLGSFTDAEKVPGWAEEYLQWAVAVGMISGKPNEDLKTQRLAPTDNATRAECAAMLKRFADKYIEQ